MGPLAYFFHKVYNAMTAGNPLTAWQLWFNALIGPAAEKVIFYVRQFIIAFRQYRVYPHKERKYLMKFFRQGVKGGSADVVKDLLCHDTVFTPLVRWGQTWSAFQGWTVFFLIIFSYVIALVMAAITFFLYKEIRFRFLLKRMKMRGFGQERYVEARYRYDKDNVETARGVFRELVDRFQLGTLVDGGVQMGKVYDVFYHDLYYLCELPVINNWQPSVRYRQRDDEHGNGLLQSFQVVFVRKGEVQRLKTDPYRYDPVRKLKLFRPISGDMAWQADDLQDEGFRRVVSRIQAQHMWRDVRFRRTFARNQQTLWVSLDQEEGSEGIILEVKAFPAQLNMLLEAMYIVMEKGKARPTTLSKAEAGDAFCFSAIPA